MQSLFLKSLTALLVVTFAGPALASSVAERQVNQQQRIAQGIGSGELNRREAARLERKEVRLHRSIVRDRYDGGRFTRIERYKAQRRLDRMSARIYRQKHDGQRR